MIGLLMVHPAAPRTPDDVPPLEVEMIQESAERRGAPAPAPSTASAAAPQTGGTDVSAVSPPPTEVNLGAGLQDRAGLEVRSDTIRPPAPDARFRNRPPDYPLDAAAAGAEGRVRLLIRVNADGRPGAVLVAGSSGNGSLDRAARDAVLKWHFTPARQGGRTVPFDYLLDVDFTRDGR